MWQDHILHKFIQKIQTSFDFIARPAQVEVTHMKYIGLDCSVFNWTKKKGVESCLAEKSSADAWGVTAAEREEPCCPPLCPAAPPLQSASQPSPGGAPPPRCS